MRIERVNRGRGHSYRIVHDNGEREPISGVTTILSAGLPKVQLRDWAARFTASYAVDHWEELATKPISKRMEEIRQSSYQHRNAMARRGSEIHSYADRLTQGEEVDVPEELTRHVDNYLRFVDEWQLRELYHEAVIVSYRWKYAGTFDVMGDMAGARWLLDFKTGDSGIYPEVALQLAAYRYADALVDEHGNEIPMPSVDKCGVVWIRADGYDVLPITADAEVFRTFLYAQQMAQFCNEPRDAFIGDAMRAPTNTPRLEGISNG